MQESAESRIIELIGKVWGGGATAGIVAGRGDDCAVVRSPDGAADWLLTADQVVQGRHFIKDRHPVRDLGRKAVVRSLSDIAAMGGRPVCFAQTLCLPDWAARLDWQEEFQQGMRAAVEETGLSGDALLGGDVSAGDLFVATVTAMGQVDSGTALLRSGACPGHLVYLSGTLGGSAQGLKLLLGESPPPFDHPAVRRHCAPRARLALGASLRELPATAALDISDGLAVDANRLADASGVSVVIEASRVPVFPGSDLAEALASGEEYELLFTCDPACAGLSGLDVTRIGRVESGEGAWLESAEGRQPLVPAD